MCLIYSDESERQKIISKFVDSGLKSKEKVFYFANSMSPDDFRNWLISEGIAVPENAPQSQLVCQDAFETYCPNGRFVPEQMYDLFRESYTKMVQHAYRGARVSGEMGWALQDVPGRDRLMEYESLVNALFVQYPFTAICQYDANLFDSETILNVLKVHPMIIVKGLVQRNPYYMKPEEFMQEWLSTGHSEKQDAHT